MTMKKLLDGIDTVRAVINQSGLSAEEKIKALGPVVDTLRNDIQDFSESVYADYQIPEDAQIESEAVVELYERLRDKPINDLIFFYKRSVFKEINSAAARVELARVLCRIAEENHANLPDLWKQVITSAGVLGEGRDD